MSAEDNLRAALLRFGAAPEKVEQLVAENMAAVRRARATIREQVLREAGDVADELIAGLDRTGDQYAFVKADAYRAYSDRLHELADGGVASAGRVRTRTFGFPGQSPFLTVRLAFGPDLTDTGIDTAAEQIGTAARLAIGMTAEDVAERGQDDTGTADDGDRVVAYRAPSLLFLCRTCCHGGAAFTPVTSDDLIDGANCGNDVLIDPPVPATEQDDIGTAVPNYFRPGHTYTRPSHGRQVEFQVTQVSTAPDGSQRRAFGWHRIEGYSSWSDYSNDDYATWTDTTAPTPADGYAGTRGEPGPVNQ